MPIPPAYAAPAEQPDPFLSFLPLIVIFVLFWFLIIRPQMKRAKEQRQMQEALQKGDEVVTSGGQLGRVVDLKEQYVTLEVAKGVHSIFQRGAIQTVLPKGTMKDL
jgi:preprotein translocase subunit YajC